MGIIKRVNEVIYEKNYLRKGQSNFQDNFKSVFKGMCNLEIFLNFLCMLVWICRKSQCMGDGIKWLYLWMRYNVFFKLMVFEFICNMHSFQLLDYFLKNVVKIKYYIKYV